MIDVTAILENPTTWVAASFFLFCIAFAKFALTPVVKALDNRAAQIKKELDEASALRAEAAAILADYKRRHDDVKKEAEEMLAHTRAEAANLKKMAEEELKIATQRRMKLAEDKIARAETDAIKQLQSNLADIALTASHTVLKTQLTADKDNDLIDAAIKDIVQVLH